jgi:Phytanoyl-CoA dioxygenase (PhyH)
MSAPPVASTTERGSLGVCHLKRIWSSALAARSGVRVERKGEAERDLLVVSAMGLAMHQTYEYLYANAPTFGQFEEWIVATAGRPETFQVDRLNASIAGEAPSDAVRQWLDGIEKSDPGLTAEELSFWEENGYVVVKNAVPEAARALAEKTIWDYIGADPDSPSSWYDRRRDEVHGIMVELIQHAALDATRASARIHKAFAQIWGTANLWLTADRCGFHPPQDAGHPFPGPDLHWDYDFSAPHRLGTQGILYLTDTPPEQGALTLVPGFHRRLPDWLATLPPEADPQKEDLHALGSFAVGAKAGDLVIWHHALPHGSRPNLGTRPRIVQYLTMMPA